MSDHVELRAVSYPTVDGNLVRSRQTERIDRCRNRKARGFSSIGARLFSRQYGW